MKINKKGQMQMFASLAVGIAVLAILLTITFLILDEGREQALDLSTTFSVTDQSYAITADTFTTLSARCAEEATLSVTQVFNGTGPNEVLLNSGNYTVTLNQINVSDNALGAGVATLGSNVNVSFSCTEKNFAYNSTSTLTNATNDIPGWVPLIVIAVIGAALLGLVNAFRRS